MSRVFIRLNGDWEFSCDCCCLGFAFCFCFWGVFWCWRLSFSCFGLLWFCVIVFLLSLFLVGMFFCFFIPNFAQFIVLSSSYHASILCLLFTHPEDEFVPHRVQFNSIYSICSPSQTCRRREDPANGYFSYSLRRNAMVPRPMPYFGRNINSGLQQHNRYVKKYLTCSLS